MMRGFRALLLIALTFAERNAARTEPTLRALLVEYRCPVVDRLERIYAHVDPRFGDPSSHVDRFLAITNLDRPHGYVQCMFVHSRTRLLCETSSGFHLAAEGQPRTFRLSRDAVEALGRLGFSTDDTRGNFRLEREVGDKPDFNALADLMLRALHDGYGARSGSRLRANAPFARRASPACIPVS